MHFCDLHLGKGVVPCKDTPNFIANRIGCFFGATVHKLTVEGDYTVEEVDALTGPLIGLPKSASFRLVDIIGLDVWVHVLRNLYELAPHDPAPRPLRASEFMERMMERGWLGEKRGQGFYKRVGKGAEKEIHAIDLKTLEYHPAQKVRSRGTRCAASEDLRAAAARAGGRQRSRRAVSLAAAARPLYLLGADGAARFPDRIVEIDRAMRWGFAFKLGPFETVGRAGRSETGGAHAQRRLRVPEHVERCGVGREVVL